MSDPNSSQSKKLPRFNSKVVQKRGARLGAGEIVMLHLWIRQHKVDGNLSITGVGFLEALSYTNTWAGIDLLMANTVASRSFLPPSPPAPGVRSSVNRAHVGVEAGAGAGVEWLVFVICVWPQGGSGREEGGLLK